MVRLIDADALNKELQRRVGSPTDDKLYEVNLCIIDAPVIDAIPVKWLREWQDEVGTINEWWPIIERIITVWHEEQEAK